MIYLLSSLFIILINVIPAFMPPTWTVISFLYITYDVNLLLMSFVGTLSSSTGRYLLAKFSHRIVPRFLSTFAVNNVNYIGEKITGDIWKAILFSFVWAISPIASNPLFIAVGIAKVKIRWVLTGFFAGRLISYFSLSYASKIIYDNFDAMFANQVLDIRKLIMNILGIGGIIVYLMFDWEHFIVKKRIRFNINIFKLKSKSK